jgi:rubrerythrin
MGNIFAASEIVELGIQVEKNGLDFYNTMAGQSKNQKAVGIYRYLAEQEAHHLEVFQKILDKTDKYEPAGLGADEYFDYMNALASEHVFTRKDKGRELAKKAKSDKEAVDIGIRAEEDSIIFYEGMKKVVPAYDQRIVDEVIAQEQGHLRQLVELKKDL